MTDGAASATGSVAGQIKGSRVIGTAGGKEKCVT